MCTFNLWKSSCYHSKDVHSFSGCFLVSAVDVPSVAVVLFNNKLVIYIKIVSVQISTYSLLIVTLIYRMWHRKLERHGGELGFGGSSWSNDVLGGLSLHFGFS